MSDDLNAPPPTDDLDKPLGKKPAKKRSFRLPFTPQQAGLAALVLFLTAFGGLAIFGDNPFGGEPMVVVAVVAASDDAALAKPDAKKPPDAAAPNGQDAVAGPRHSEGPAGTPPPPGSKTVTIIDGSSGKREEVVIPGSVPPQGQTPAQTPAQAPASGLDDRLMESTRHGLIPKLGPDGTRPADAFGRAVVPLAGKPDAPRIALVVTGLGIGSAGTADAFAKLPGAVTFALSPYANDLERLAARARGEGHELLLQLPMEPFDYPDNDPGPQTLLTSLTVDQNMDRLHWLFSRFQGYVGVVNFMGERFTGTEASLSPILRETAKRGLIYFDDSSSTRSLAGQITSASSLAFVKAGVVVDAVPAPGEIDRALSRLEAMARERGVAVGTAGSLPVTVERLSKWAKGAAQRGILLVPISAVVGKAKSS